MTAKDYAPTKFLWATIAFVLFLGIFISLVLLYLGNSQNKVMPVATSLPTTSLTPVASSESQPGSKTYQSKYGFKITYPTAASIDTSIDKSSPSLERLTISSLDTNQPPKASSPSPGLKGFYGYSVDLSVESKKGTLNDFADRDSLTSGNGKRQFFTVTTLGNQSGYKVLIRDVQDYYTYYLPLANTNWVLVITTSSNGPNHDKWDSTVSKILDSLVLLD